MTSSPALKRLYYASPTPAAPGAPRLLLVIYNFPPDPAVGGLRWQELSRYFAAHGWAIDVITRDFEGVSGRDEARLQRLPVGVRVFSVPDREPLLSRIQHFVWPLLRRIAGHFRRKRRADALSQEEIFNQQGPRTVLRSYRARMEFAKDKLWARAAASTAVKVMKGDHYEAVVSSGPPHMAHEAARLISQRTGTPFVVDMRDPWSMVQRLRESIASPTWVKYARRYESRIVDRAAFVTMNTQAARSAMRAAYPEQADKFEVIRNGADDEPLPPPVRDACFRIRFAGIIYMDRDPRPIFRAARRVISALHLTPEQFRIELAGQAHTFDNSPTADLAKQEGVGDFLTIGAQMSRQKTMEFLAGASVLLSLPQDSDYAIPAKIYEYVRFHAWMLVLAMPNSATATLLQDSAADVLEPGDMEGIASVLAQHYQQFVRGELPEPVNADGRFSRELQAERLMTLITEHVAPTGLNRS